MNAVDVHEILREAEAQKAARTEQFPDVQNVIRMMVQCRLRLEELGWRDIGYAPKDGRIIEVINAGWAGPCDGVWLGKGWFVAENNDWWPCTPMMFRPKSGL